ncbi:MAG: xanthine dehydrogenase family protein subunit M [Spirochaetales bacterium]|nr:xanthine dehydrogenase family protein subunit M [Spirochaetales bacterium]
MVTAYRPATLQEALSMLKETDGIPLSGGTDLMVRLRAAPGTPARFSRPLVYVGSLPELLAVEHSEGGSWSIGAGVPLSDLLKLKGLPEALGAAIREIGSPAIRNTATLGGNICNASPAADSLPALLCLNASARIAGPGGERLQSLEDFITGPGKTALKSGELLVSILIPPAPPMKLFYRKIGTRRANALSKLSVLGMVKIENDTVKDLRLAVGAAAPKVVRIPEAEKSCIGRSVSQVAADHHTLLSMYREKVRPITDQRSTAGYRERTALRLIEEFLTKELSP